MQALGVEFDAQAEPGADARSRLGAALRRHTRLRQIGGEMQVCVGDNVVARVHAGVVTEHRPLTAFGARFLAENGVPLANGPLQCSRTQLQDSHHRLQTDLHSHFAGCLSGVDLVDLGLTVNAVLAQAVLAQAGISCERDMPLSALDSTARARFACALDIPLDRQVTFLDMERLYAMRAALGTVWAATVVYRPACSGCGCHLPRTIAVQHSGARATGPGAQRVTGNRSAAWRRHPLSGCLVPA